MKHLLSASVLASACVYDTHAFSSSIHARRSSSSRDAGLSDFKLHAAEKNNPSCEVLLMDHFNINHEKGRHDALKAFYFDFLGCAIDPRKEENIARGSKTLWANVGMHQFHLPEGKPNAQVFDGVITLIHEDLSVLMERYNDYLDGDERFAPLKDTEFLVGVLDEDELLMVTDPWGNEFSIMASDDPEEDRASDVGAQPLIEGHEPSEGLKIEDLTVYVPHDANLEGIGRFYAHVLGAEAIDELGSESSISISMGERQTLTFQYHPDGPDTEVFHHDFSYDEQDENESLPFYPSNHGPHISLYVSDLAKAYESADKLGVTYVNPRFKRRAYSEEEALDQCMFRIIDIIDPLDESKEIILHLEHEVRSTKTRDGKKYKSCPLNEV
mmetsp:Transcript_15181/g.24948  ORF Transcript_15181/g.24948 Transcript_15181/m.24948 type:complete len:384 (-) Transcript_15181:54-1205(-)